MQEHRDHPDQRYTTRPWETYSLAVDLNQKTESSSPLKAESSLLFANWACMTKVGDTTLCYGMTPQTRRREMFLHNLQRLHI